MFTNKSVTNQKKKTYSVVFDVCILDKKNKQKYFF